MNRILSISPLLLLAVVAQWTLLPLIWQWQLGVAQETGQHFRHEKNLVRLKLSNQEWVAARVDRHEIRLDGIMYDVKEIQYTRDSVELTVYPDHKESQLLSCSDHYFQKKINNFHIDQVSPVPAPEIVRYAALPDLTIPPPFYREQWCSICIDKKELPPWN